MKQKSVFKEIVSNQLKLPNMKRIKIDCISDGDRELNRFFQEWMPDQLEYFVLNNTKINAVGVNFKLYTSAFSKKLIGITKECFFEWIEFKEDSLKKIIKSAYNCERLIFNYCDIHCSTALDFHINQMYRIKYLSFQNCGNVMSKERKTDWKTLPNCFKNIVDAISKCGLKDSLEKINILGNNDLKKENIEKNYG